MEVPSAKTRRLVIVSMLAIAAALFAVAVFISRGNPTASDLPLAIQSVDPVPGSNVLSQSDVAVDLAVGYTAELELNGVVIPEAELFRVEGLNQVSFKPGVGKSVERLLPDRNCVRVIYWQIANGPEDTSVYTWCFDAS